jgi:hypothetical protein
LKKSLSGCFFFTVASFIGCVFQFGFSFGFFFLPPPKQRGQHPDIVPPARRPVALHFSAPRRSGPPTPPERNPDQRGHVTQ